MERYDRATRVAASDVERCPSVTRQVPQDGEAEVTLLAPVLRGALVKPHTVVCDREFAAAIGNRDPDHSVLRPAVFHDVSQRLLGDPIDDGLVDIGQASDILDLSRHGDPPCRHLRTQVGQGVGEPGRPQVGWIQLDEKRTGLAHRGTDSLGTPLDGGDRRRIRGSVG